MFRRWRKLLETYRRRERSDPSDGKGDKVSLRALGNKRWIVTSQEAGSVWQARVHIFQKTCLGSDDRLAGNKHTGSILVEVLQMFASLSCRTNE